jgi:hypothetical protein
MSFSNSRLMDSAWARITGTRMQVPVIFTSFSPQIFFVSLTCTSGGRDGEAGEAGEAGGRGRRGRRGRRVRQERKEGEAGRAGW